MIPSSAGVMLCLRWGPYADMVALHEAKPFRGRQASLATPTAFGIRLKGGQLNEVSMAGPEPGAFHPRLPEAYDFLRHAFMGHVFLRHVFLRHMTF